MSSAYLQFENESDKEDHSSSEDHESIVANNDKHKFHIGSYCYSERKAFSVITNIQFDECVILNLSNKQRKNVKLSSLQLITDSKHLRKAQNMHQKHKKNLQSTRMKIKSHRSINSVDKTAKQVELTGKQQRDETFRKVTGKAQQKFCGPNCCIHATYSICFVLFAIFVGLTIWFMNYGEPLMQNGMDFQDTLVKTKCSITKYKIMIDDCNYECYKCDDIANCNKCNGPWCSTCHGSWYKYYATANSLCGQDIILESQLNTGDCPIAGNDLLNVGSTYDCYVAMQNDQCKYNGNSVFVFSDNDSSIAIGKKYVDLGYCGIALAFTCLAVICVIRCKKCIKNLPCMN